MKVRIQIHHVLVAKRKELGITQEQFANYLGVSKPAVSKWESGKSYPDITLLPVIASYFNMSIDDLLGYESEMTKEEINELYKRLAKSFATESFDQVYEQCHVYLKKYASCWRLLFSIGTLLVNHAHLSGTREKTDSIFREAIRIFDRIINFGDDPVLSKQALHLKAICHLSLGQPNMAIEILEDVKELPMNEDVLLAKAYQMKGDYEKAKGLLQAQIFKNLIGIFQAYPDLISLYSDELEKMEDFFQQAIELGKVFRIEQFRPTDLLFILYLGAEIYLRHNEKQRALELLEKYVDTLLKPGILPFQLKGNSLFDQLEDFFDELDLGKDAPRNSEVILQDLKKSVIDHPTFAPLHGEERYQRIVQKLKQL
ncbi:helix-turn-helix domain-containing protein [Fervidibacillus halotolerans]|uniref:Helix-turn-helix domain-containing protein n=1 Tax=Fervidibacillus halotolerans TaxID=2980027 RepID=A0A9E8M0S4_9BACI|nr:helix-turn-helix domain-containing protein [Fervidibacillus halotolerans]WAA12877.1 helix-turn-helix domain-containing protein [Fervidibacillus halotolerans]